MRARKWGPPSFYGVVCNGTNEWEFRAEAQDFDSTLHDVQWYLNGWPKDTDLSYVTGRLDPGRYIVSVVFTETAILDEYHAMGKKKEMEPLAKAAEEGLKQLTPK